MNRIEINADACKGCGLCVEACPKNILALSPDKLNASGLSPAEVTDMSQCLACTACGLTCPDSVITVYRD
ncbi:MAG: 4Fe-4S binding protein [Clostridiales Family XIII bacterium]|jgi:2-oxoglutarate ferredoxin oxidoreductase subunit delta|nr:4Fe-4S binding protein [Clostridiales Family XIII bacterium]